MNIPITLSLLIGFGLRGCDSKPSNAIKPANFSQDQLVYTKFHGKYKIISATSREPLEVNFDGKASSNMLEEINELNYPNREQYGVILRANSPLNAIATTSYYSFTQPWPEQYISVRTNAHVEWNGGDALDYNPSYVVNYAM